MEIGESDSISEDVTGMPLEPQRISAADEQDERRWTQNWIPWGIRCAPPVGRRGERVLAGRDVRGSSFWSVRWCAVHWAFIGTLGTWNTSLDIASFPMSVRKPTGMGWWWLSVRNGNTNVAGYAWVRPAEADCSHLTWSSGRARSDWSPRTLWRHGPGDTPETPSSVTRCMSVDADKKLLTRSKASRGSFSFGQNLSRCA